MQLDDLKSVWSAHGALLEQNLRVNQRLLREVMTRKLRWALLPYVLWRTFEVLVGLAGIVLVGLVLGDHLDNVRYVLMAGAVLLFAVAITGKGAWLLVGACRLDYGARVTELQRATERLKRFEFRAFKWALLGGIVVWLPAAMLLFEALLGVDVLARADLAWLLANVAFGLVLLGIGQSLARRHVERADLKPWARRLVDRISGRELAAVSRQLDELASFERDDPV